MPKELVYSREALAARDTTTPHLYPVEHVAIGWAPDRDVQIGIVPGPSVALNITDGVTVSTTSTNGPHGGLWMDLDRAGINRLIRSLRKARDAAYGSDA